jgi:DUF2075 family protein
MKTPEGKAKINRIIKNTYKVILTRGQKGCYVHPTDPDTRDYLRQRAKSF